jgi:hypothetical protein
MSSDAGGQPYAIAASTGTMEVIRRLYNRARDLGVLDRFSRSMEDIYEALRTRPNKWGDPIANLRGLRMTQYRRVYDELRVVYGVHLDHPVVWLASVAPVMNHPLRAGDG